MSLAWKKNLLLTTLLVAGMAFCVYWLLPTNRVPDPQSFDTQWRQRSDVAQLLEELDQEFSDAWQKQGLQATGRATSLEVCRRLSLGLIGSVPSLEEIRKLEQQPEGQRVNWWLSRLLEDKRSSDYVAERLARTYVGNDEGPFLVFRRNRFVSWLSHQLHNRRPYNEIVHDMLVDRGIWTDAAAVNFMTATITEESTPDPIVLAGRTSRAFLGMRIDCLQCHDDFLGTVRLGNADQRVGGRQEHFHQLAAFFNDAELGISGIRDTREIQHYMYQFLDQDQETQVTEGVPFAAELLPAEGPRRQRLAAWITHRENKQFARAFVNRMWAILAGQPLVDPIDDLPLHGPYPAGLERLANDFIEHDFDVQRLIRVIANTQAFQQASRADFEISSQHERYWAAFPLTRLRPEQVAGSVIQATSLVTIDSRAHVLRRLVKYGLANDFVTRYGDAGDEEFLPRGSTVTQRLLLLNGDMVTERLTNRTAPQWVADLNSDNTLAVETAYLTILTRKPDAEELEYFLRKLDESSNRPAALEDLYWVLINSIEFGWNH